MTGADERLAGRRLIVASAGFLRDRRIARILTLAGLPPRLGLPGATDLVGVWGARPVAARGLRLAAARGAGVQRIEEAFLRGIHPGRAGRDGPLGLLLDDEGLHFDATRPSRLETLLARAPLDDTPLLDRARDGIARLRAADLSKINLHDPRVAPPPPGYVLIVDQTRGDAAICGPGIGHATFREMLVTAQEAYPLAPILIRSHPETAAGLRPGHFTPADARGRIAFADPALSPWALLDGAIAVYAVSSQLGFEAILAGHRPHIYGQPFYAGWGLTEDMFSFARRGRRLTRAQLFAGAMLLYPTWYDPCRDRLCRFEEAVDQLEAEVRAFREDRAGHVATGMRLWKRRHLQRMFGREVPLRFVTDPQAAARQAAAGGQGLLVWASHADALPAPQATAATPTPPLRRVEDGFLRSQGLGAALVPPLSLVADDLGIYYDPGRESRLERLISAPCPPAAMARAARLRRAILAAALGKYGRGDAGPPLPPLPPGRRILVPGQVEDDASIRLGAGAERSNLALLARVRAENPDAVILYRPHPDVQAGLRPGAVPAADLARLADHLCGAEGLAGLLGAVDEVWTITSTLGFEALLRGLPVTCLGAPFYAGWGLTRDLGPVPARRTARPTLDALTHACLIAYPRYLDPVSGRPCPAEVAVERLAAGETPQGPGLRWLARAQGLLAGQAHLWR